MAVDLMELVKGAVSHSAREGLSGILGEDADHSVCLFESAAGLVLGGLKIRSGSVEGATEIHKMARDQDFGLIDRFGSILTDDARSVVMRNTGGRILESVFGSRHPHVVGNFARSSGLEKPAAGELLELAAPIVMGIVGRVVSKQSLNSRGLASLLSSQPEFVSTPVVAKNSTTPANESAGSYSATTAVPGDKSSVMRDAKSPKGESMMKYAVGFCVGGAMVVAVFWYLNRLEVLEQGTEPTQAVASPDESAGSSTSDNSLTGPPETVPEKEGFDLENLLAKFGNAASGFKNISAENASDIAEQLTLLGESIDSFGLDRLKGLSRNLFGIAVAKFRTELDALADRQNDEQIRNVIQPAIRKIKDKLAEHGF